jgi:hypothetical protein
MTAERKGLFMINLESLSLQELERLKSQIEEIIKSKKSAESKEFTFNFNATNDPRKGKPYVARLYWADSKLQREFKDLAQTWGKKEVNVSGTYTANAGDIIEKRTGGSWKNDYRAWYYISSTGEEIKVADIDNAAEKAKTQSYLQGKITAEELLK